jgi:superfamily II DNA/RNA helicase
VQAAIEAAGYTEPTPIQAKAIPIAVTGRDVLGIAQTGTGKTAGFVLPMLTRLETGRARARMPRSLILAPTRELAAQVAQSFEKYGVQHRLTVALLIGGVSFDEQLRLLDRGADVLIATPGRLLDHFGRGKILLTGVEILVIDEADRMLDMGFIPDIERICKLLPPRRQTLFFSATMPPEIKRLVDTFLKDPARVEVAKPATTAKTITQLFRYCPSTDDWAKREVLRDLIRTENVKNAIIFCNRKRDVAILLKSLQKHGFNAGALHGDMDQSSRTATLDAFREGRLSLLAASDVAARGLDIPDVSHIFNFDVPWQSDDYVHRIGRTGRAGKEGRSLTLVTPEDVKQLKDIEKMLGVPATWIGDPPSAEDLAAGLSRRRGRGRGGRQATTASPPKGRAGAPSRSGPRPARQNGHSVPAPAAAPQPEARAEAPVERTRPAREPRPRRAPERQPEAQEARAPRQNGNRTAAPRTRQPRQPAAPAREPWEPRVPRRSDREDRGPTPVGMGDHVPAFLRKTTRVS